MKIWLIILCSLVLAIAEGQYHPDRHNSSYNAGWLSCDTKASPNSERSSGHWIMYDLGDVYQLGKTTIWNTNYSGHTDMGIKDLAIDYSTDGKSWIPFGEYEVPIAPASSFYTGVDGPDLTGMEARFLLITALSNHGGSCTGFSEIRFLTSGIVSSAEDYDLLEGELGILPNPMAGNALLTITGVERGDYILMISDMGGKVIERKKINIHGGKTSEAVVMDDHPDGMYTVTLTNGKKLKSITFNKSGQ